MTHDKAWNSGGFRTLNQTQARYAVQCTMGRNLVPYIVPHHIHTCFFLPRQMEGGGGRYGGRQTDSEVSTAASQLGKKKILPICNQLPYFIEFLFKLKRVAPHMKLTTPPVSPFQFWLRLNTSRMSPAIFHCHVANFPLFRPRWRQRVGCPSAGRCWVFVPPWEGPFAFEDFACCLSL